MKNKLIPALFLFVFSFAIQSCKDDDDNGLPPSTSVNDFVWKSMNLWYYWQSQVPNLADNRFGSSSEYQNFIQSMGTSQFFYSLLYDYGNTDRFSWIVDDYHTLDNQFAGINRSFGMDYGLVYINANSDVLFGYVQYVLPNSPASNAGLKRGDIFTRINGTPLNSSNYTQLLANNTATFGMGYIQNGELFQTSTEHTISKVELQENPVYMSSVIEMNGHKIGYLVYNNFRANFNDELNDAIGNLKNQGISDLVIDLRYNGGGSVQTAAYLGSMITGQFNNQDFTHLTFNQKTSNNNKTYKFENQGKLFDNNLNEIGNFPLQHLNLNKIYVLTTRNTASASEMLISCLAPYIEVVTIGMKTYGKTVGSITVYDSPSTYYTSSSNSNPNHTWALQPIVFEYKNAQNQPSPLFGIQPEQEVNEIHYLENLPQLGDPNEPLLNSALSLITSPKTNPIAPSTLNATHFKSSQNLENFGTEMYLDKGVI